MQSLARKGHLTRDQFAEITTCALRGLTVSSSNESAALDFIHVGDSYCTEKKMVFTSA